jgi:xylulokinase
MGRGDPDHVLTIDVGTSAARVSAVSLTGRVMASERRPVTPLVQGTSAVLDPAATWAEVQALLVEVIARTGPPTAFGVSAQLGLVLVDAELDPVGPVMLWQDRRASIQAEDLDRLLGSRARHLAGRVLTAEHAAPRLMWIARNDPAAWARTRWILTFKDYLLARLSGTVATDAASASYTYLFDVRQRTWSDDLAAAAGVNREHLPPVLDGAEGAGGLRQDLATAIGARSGTPVAVGGPDGSVAVLGAGGARAGQTVDVAGSTDVVLHVRDQPLDDPAGRTVLNGYLLGGLWTIGGPTGLTGGAIAWLSRLLGDASVESMYTRLGDAAEFLAPGADGVSMQTALTGERFPTWAGHRAGSFGGLRADHTAAHLLRAAEEGGAFAVLEGLDVLEQLGATSDGIRVVGGILQRQASAQLRADAWQRRVLGAADHEATTLGAAILAGIAGGAFEDHPAAAAAMLADPVVYEPAATTADAYRLAYDRWRLDRDRVPRDV